MLLQDEFSGMGHYIFIMLSKNTNKATIIEQTGGEKVDEKKALQQFANYISDYTYRYNWRHEGSGQVTVRSFSQHKSRKKREVNKNIWYLSYHMVKHEPRFTNAVDCGPVSLVILFDIFNKLVNENWILVQTIKTVIKNINRYTVHESGCNIIRELVVKSPIYYNRAQEIIDEKEYMPVTDGNKDHIKFQDYIKIQKQPTKLS